MDERHEAAGRRDESTVKRGPDGEGGPSGSVRAGPREPDNDTRPAAELRGRPSDAEIALWFG